MARIYQGKDTGSSRGKPILFRGAQAVGGAAARGVGRLVRRLLIIVLVVVLVGWWARSVAAKLRTPDAPSRSVSAVDSGALERWKAARTKSLVLTESDITSVFSEATKLPTFPFSQGQVVVHGDHIEIFGRLRSPAWTATVTAIPVVEKDAVKLAVQQVRVGTQLVPGWLEGLVALPALTQASVIANTALPPVATVETSDRRLTITFQ